MSDPSPRRPAGRLPWVRALLRVPLFYKLLIANSVIVVLGAIFGTLMTSRLVSRAEASPGELLVLFAGIGVLVSVAVNAVIVRLALSPLERLEDTTRRVERGELDARVRASPLADADLARLMATFDAMLDRLTEYQHRLRVVARRALTAQEEERKRIARELHDDTAQRLAALQLRLAVARNTPDTAQRERALDELRDDMESVGLAVRRFARGLRPPELNDLGLIAALEAHARTVAQADGVRVRVSGDRIAGSLSAEAELTLYRTAQEAITNAIQHGRAAAIEVTVAGADPAGVLLTVADDGRGFDPEVIESQPERGLGIFGMRERASYVGGNVTITSQPGQGTVVEVRIPTLEGEVRG